MIKIQKNTKTKFWCIGIDLMLAVLVISGAAALAHSRQIHAADPGGNSTDFVITVKTDNTGVSNPTSFTIPTTGIGYSYNVDCGGGGATNLTNQTGNATCSYSAAGTYTIRISGTFPRIYFYSISSTSSDKLKLLQVNQWGTNAWTDMSRAFQDCTNMDIVATDTPNLTNVADLSYMFLGDTGLVGSSANWNWDTSNVTMTYGMFDGATAFNQPIGNWDTSNVTMMFDMFNGATAFNQPINTHAVTVNGNTYTAWSTSKVTIMAGMFNGATAFNQPIGNWDTSSVTIMAGMFDGATAFNQPINTHAVTVNGNTYTAWSTSKVTLMSGMFEYAIVFNQDISSWSFVSVTDSGAILGTANSFSTENYDKLLISVDKQNLQTSVMFGNNSPVTYCYAADARANIISSDSWTITDAGQKCSTIHYDGNQNASGTVPADNTTGDVISDNSGSLTRTGYTFAGWNTAADGSGTTYTANEVPYIYTDTTLYAKWVGDPYALSFNSEGGNTVADETVAYNSLAAKPTAPTKVGYTFAGWYKDSALTTVWNFNTDTMPAADTTLYAKWTVNAAPTPANNNSDNNSNSISAPNTGVKVTDDNAGIFVVIISSVVLAGGIILGALSKRLLSRNK